jgi:hypothetical protein
MTNLKLFKKAVPLLILPMANFANAVDVTANLTFTTLPVIVVTEDTPMSFGPVLSLAQAADCTMSAIAGSVITASDDGNDSTTPAGGTLTGDCTGSGQPGVYTITSVATAELSVSVSAVTPGVNIGFEPIGIVIDRGANTRDPVTTAAAAVVTASTIINSYTGPGTNRVIMGGTITNQQNLTSGGTYTSQFVIDVVYQ